MRTVKTFGDLRPGDFLYRSDETDKTTKGAMEALEVVEVHILFDGEETSAMIFYKREGRVLSIMPPADTDWINRCINEQYNDAFYCNIETYAKEVYMGTLKESYK